MFALIAGIALVLAALVLLFTGKGLLKKAIGLVPGLLGAALLVSVCVTFVPTGYTGIVTTFGKVENGTLDAGLVVKAPWQEIVKMDNRLQEETMILECFSSDIQEVNVNMSIGYRINQANAMTIYKEIGVDYVEIAVTPRVEEVVKAVIAHYDASSLIASRDEASALIDTQLEQVLARYNIDLSYAAITNIDFTDTFTEAVEAKVKAEQQREQAETEAEKRKVEAQAEADAAVIAAEAKARQEKIAADAELYAAQQKAEANRALEESLNETLLAYYQITQVDSLWDGALPIYVGGDTTIPVLNNVG